MDRASSAMVVTAIQITCYQLRRKISFNVEIRHKVVTRTASWTRPLRVWEEGETFPGAVGSVLDDSGVHNITFTSIGCLVPTTPDLASLVRPQRRGDHAFLGGS